MNENIGPQKIFFDYLKSNKMVYFLGFFSVFATNLLQVFLARSVGWAIDILSHHPLRFNWGLTELFFAVLLGQILIVIFRALWRLTLARQTHHTSGIFKEEIWRKACYFSDHLLQGEMNKGALMSACTADVGSARFLFGFNLVGLSDFIFLTGMSFFAMATINQQVALYAFIALVPLPFLMKWVSEKEAISFDQSQNKLSEFNDYSSQAVSTLRLQKMTNSGSYWKREWFHLAEFYRQIRYRSTLLTLRWIPAMGGISLACNTILFMVGIRYVYQDKMSIGDFMAMHGLIFLVQEPLTNLGWIFSEFRKAFVALRRLSKIYNTKEEWQFLREEKEDLKQNNNLNNSPMLLVQNLSFKFNPNDKFLFSHFNLTLNRGDRVGITGTIGCGKTVLLSLLSGMRQGHLGEIKIEGRDPQDFNHEDLRKKITIVTQTPFLFASSVRENIALGINPSEEQLLKAIKISELEFDIAKMPSGIETPLGEWGINLSGGQKQRLSLARALVRNSPLLFLDDCLSAIDTVTEEKILKNLDRELSDTTILWVAHRASTLKYCHRIINLEEFK